jgi:hypothetical protein
MSPTATCWYSRSNRSATEASNAACRSQSSNCSRQVSTGSEPWSDSTTHLERPAFWASRVLRLQSVITGVDLGVTRGSGGARSSRPTWRLGPSDCRLSSQPEIGSSDCLGCGPSHGGKTEGLLERRWWRLHVREPHQASQPVACACPATMAWKRSGAESQAPPIARMSCISV